LEIMKGLVVRFDLAGPTRRARPPILL
jgi:hypothetical protein